ncbi:MAG: THUMP domain-containing protein [Planctomycetes bacterium]|nr:THUMP domain-containing protein [Planctomycetota bacterium]
MACLTLHYHELALKGANRPRFVRALVQNARRALGELGPCRAESTGGRILVETGAEMAAAVARALKIPGVVHVMPVTRLPRDLDAVAAAAVAELRRLAPASFRVSARRNDKSFPMTSVEIDREVGARVHEALGIPVRLKGAEREVHLAVRPGEILRSAEKVGGPGGLPTGTGTAAAAWTSSTSTRTRSWTGRRRRRRGTSRRCSRSGSSARASGWCPSRRSRRRCG